MRVRVRAAAGPIVVETLGGRVLSTVSTDSSVATAAMLNYSSASAAFADVDDPIVAGLRRSAWVKIGLVAFLFVGVFWPNLSRIWNKVNPIYGDPNWQHGIFVPLISLYFLYVNREELLKTPARASWVGLGVLIAGLLLSMYSVWPLQNDFVWDFGMVLTLFGVVLLTCGWQVMKIAWFPIAFLVCAMPWPGLFYSEIAWPLQTVRGESRGEGDVLRRRRRRPQRYSHLLPRQGRRSSAA